VFGREKLNKDPLIVSSIARIVARYDFLLFQEIRDASGEAFTRLMAEVTKVSGKTYKFVISERLGKTDSKEQYAYVFDPSKGISVVASWVAPNVKGVFERPPFVAQGWCFSLLLFLSFFLKKKNVFAAKIGANDVVFVGLHAAPNNAAAELTAMTTVLKGIEVRVGKSLPTVFMGDLNADCAYLCASCLSAIKIHSDKRFSWQIRRAGAVGVEGAKVATTTTGSQCVYDRIITSGFQAGAMKSASVFRFDEAFGLNAAQTAKVSDHYPVEIVLFEEGSGLLKSDIPPRIIPAKPKRS
jgi:hypothetical protein